LTRGAPSIAAKPRRDIVAGDTIVAAMTARRIRPIGSPGE